MSDPVRSQELRDRLVDAGFAEERVEHVIHHVHWRYLGGRTIAEALMDGDGPMVDEAIAAYEQGFYL